MPQRWLKTALRYRLLRFILGVGKATVPGTVLANLVNDGVYPEPLYGESNRPDKIPESLNKTPYWTGLRLLFLSLTRVDRCG
jgi:hypothetical protein